MNITYVFTVCLDYYTNDSNIPHISIPGLTNIMTNILDNQKELNITYSNIPLQAILTFRELGLSNKEDYFRSLKYFCKNVAKEIKDEYVMISLGSYPDLLFAKELLKIGKKVILGGSITKPYKTEIFRKILYEDNFVNLQNLMIIRSYINKNTNLYNLIKCWKDVEIDIYNQPDLTESHLSDKDFFLEYRNTLKEKNIKIHGINVVLFGTCNWGKCTFCHTLKSSGEVKPVFSNEYSIKESAEFLIEKLNQYDTDIIHINDPVFLFNKTTITFLKILRNHNLRASIYTSIKQLQNEDYFNLLFHEYGDVITGIEIGEECFDDFALNLLGKGITASEIFDINIRIVKENIKTDIIHLLISGLAYKNIKDIHNNYKKMKLLNEIYGNNFHYYLRKLRIYPLTTYPNNPFIKLNNSKYSFKSMYDRIDENGNLIIGSDKQITNHDFIEI